MTIKEITPLTPSKLKQLRDRRETVKMALQCCRSDLGNPARLIKDIEDTRAIIVAAEKRIEANQRRLETMESDFNSLTEELTKLNLELRIEEHDSQIRAIKKLSTAIAAMSLTADDVRRSIYGD